jgi:type IV secretion system protein VirD4
METAKRIAEMAGEVWEVRPQESVQRPYAILGPRKGQVTYREERRPLLLPGDVRQLARDEQLVFVSGAKPLRTKKLRFDQEPILATRMRRASREPVTLTTTHDWEHVAPIGMLPAERKAAGRSSRPAPEPAPRAQGDLFARGDEREMSVSERANKSGNCAGLRPPPEPESRPQQPPIETARRRTARRTGV